MSNKNFTARQIEIMEIASQIIDKEGIQELTTKNLAEKIELSEAALYRHFKSKNEILIGLLDYFIYEMQKRLQLIIIQDDKTALHLLKEIFNSQLTTFAEKPAIVSVIFSEGIFQFNKELMHKVLGMMEMMQTELDNIVKKGQEDGSFRDFLSASTVSTIIMGSMRMVVLKWKIFGHKSDLVKEGNKVLNGVLKMIKQSKKNQELPV